MNITPIYAACLGLVFFLLSFRTIRLRNNHKVAIGDGNVHELRRAIRAHSNFAEYVPFTLLLIYFLEIQNPPVFLIHLFAGCLLLGRSLHAFGVSQVKEKLLIRISGMILTFTALVGASISLFIHSIF